jgi:hypothetical protein
MRLEIRPSGQIENGADITNEHAARPGNRIIKTERFVAQHA